MLVLTRKPGESVVIGDGIKVKVLSVNGTSIRLGVEAPRNVPIHREEVFEAIRAENLRAMQTVAKVSRQIDKVNKQ